MRLAIAYSKKDIAGVNIAEELNKNYLPQIPIIELKKEAIYSEFFDKTKELKNVDFLVFASRHASKQEKPSLSLHAPGNWRNADYGGQPGKICKTSAFILKYLFQQLNKNAEQANLRDYEITLEVTHHGPLIEKPCCFIEIGSTEKHWKDKKAAEVIVKTILSLQDYKKQNCSCPAAIGIGGPHYCPNFNKIQLNSDYAISHIIPEYALPLTLSMLKEAEQKTTEQIKQILIDWKGCGKSEERQQVIEVIKKFGIEMKRTSEISRETN